MIRITAGVEFCFALRTVFESIDIPSRGPIKPDKIGCAQWKHGRHEKTLAERVDLKNPTTKKTRRRYPIKH